MSYDVVKVIRGRAYRYEVTSRREPGSPHVAKTWIYRGPVAPVADAPPRPASDQRIIDAILTLLERRDVAHCTISVIVRAAGVSRTTFYRAFRDRAAALQAAFDFASSRVSNAAESTLLHEPLGTAAVERKRLATYVAAILRSSVRSPGIQRAMSATKESRSARLRRSQRTHAAVESNLAAYIRRLQTAGLVGAGSPEDLARGMQCVISGIFKRLVYDERADDEAALLTAGTDLICRALFGPGM